MSTSRPLEAERAPAPRPAADARATSAIPASHDAIVLGADPEGLATAALLADRGLRVLVLGGGAREAREAEGREAETRKAPDPGLPDPGAPPADLVRTLELEREGLTLLRPEPASLALLPAGEPLRLWREPGRTAEALRRHAPGDAGRWPPFAARMERYAGLLARAYAAPPPEPTDLRARELPGLLGLAWRLRALGREEMVDFLRVLPTSAWELLGDEFRSEPLQGMLAAAAVRGVFQGPRSGGTAFTLLHRMVGGAVGGLGDSAVVRGGASALVAALAAAGERRGATIRADVPVERILTRGGRAVGVVAGGRELEAGCVASALDARRTFLELLGPELLAPEFVHAVGNVRYRGSWARVDLRLSSPLRLDALDGESPPEGTRVFVAPSVDDVERAYDAAKHGGLPRRPVLEWIAPGPADGHPRLDGTSRPGEARLSIVARHAPHDLDGGWDREARDALRERVLEVLSEHSSGIPETVEEAEVLAPPDLEARFGLPEGSDVGAELGLDQVLFMRPVPGWARYRSPVRGLYMCGADAHPGGGVAGAAGRNAAAVIARDVRRRGRIEA